MSLRGDKYENAEEVRFRLEGTVVLYDGKPVYITRTSLRGGDRDEEGDEFDRVWFKYLPYKPGDREVRKLLSSRHFDLTPFRMGYMNHNGKAIFVERIATRQNKQGLSNANYRATTFQDGERKAIAFEHLIQSQGFVDMVAGNYPTVADARKMLEDGAESVALSRRFAIVNDEDLDLMYVSHKGMKCGTMRPGEGVRIARKHHYLRESFQEDRINVA